MAYCAIGSMSAADWAEIKKLCKQMQDMIDEKFAELDSGEIAAIKQQLITLSNGLSALEASQRTQDSRLDKIERDYAALEITTSELLDMWEGD